MSERLAEFVELHAPEEKLRLVCTYAQRCYEAGQTVAIYAPDPAEARDLDGLLWTFAQNAFIPPVRMEGAGEPLLEPVLIFSGEPGEAGSDVLILCAEGEMPGWFTRFERLYDFAAVYDDRLREAGRKRFAACRQAGYPVRFTRRKT